MEFESLDRPIEQWPITVKVSTWHDAEGDGLVAICVALNDLLSDPFASVVAKAAGHPGARIEATQMMAELGYLPVSGRLGRWHRETDRTFLNGVGPWIKVFTTDDEEAKCRIFRRFKATPPSATV